MDLGHGALGLGRSTTSLGPGNLLWLPSPTGLLVEWGDKLQQCMGVVCCQLGGWWEEDLLTSRRFSKRSSGGGRRV